VKPGPEADAEADGAEGEDRPETAWVTLSPSAAILLIAMVFVRAWSEPLGLGRRRASSG